MIDDSTEPVAFRSMQKEVWVVFITAGEQRYYEMCHIQAFNSQSMKA